MRRLFSFLALYAVVGASLPARTRAECPTGALPAYAHNDYERRRPLAGSLALGFRGAEADVFLVNAVLRVGHSARAAAAGPTLEATYLQPLRAIAARCSGRIIEHRAAFLLTIELKEPSRAAFDSLASLLARYDDLLTPGATAGGDPTRAAVEVVLVGWHPPVAALAAHEALPRTVGIQQLVHPRTQSHTLADTTRVRLLSVNYGKAVARRWRRDPAPAEWLPAVASLRRAYPAARLRVFNAPIDTGLYRALLAGGVDLVGSEDPEATASALRAVSYAEGSSRNE